MIFQLRNLIPILLIALFSTTATAQIGRMERTSVDYDDQRVDAITFSFTPERKEVQKAFEDWIDDRYDINMKGGGLFGDKNIRTAEAVSIPAISSDNITLITRTEEKGDRTVMTLFASKGLNNYVRSDDYQAYSGLEDVFDSFLSSYLPDYYEERVAEAEENLEDLQKDHEDARDDIRKNEKRIEELRKENEELARTMSKLEKEIQDAQRTLNERREVRREVNRNVGGTRRM